MSDTPASWQPDPTGRHDHRYWDGTQWTEHVADAGVAGTDPFEGDGGALPTEEAQGPERATPAGDAPGEVTPEASTEPVDTGEAAEAAEPVEPGDAAPPAAATTASGWALPDEPTPSVSGWGSPAAPTTPAAPEEPADAAAPAEEAPTWTSETTSWGTPAPDAEPDPVPAGADETLVPPTPSPWGAPTESLPTGADAPTSSWSTTAAAPTDDLTAAPPPPVAPEGEAEDGDGRSRKILLLVLALLAIAGVIAALVVLSGDDDEGDAERISNRISSALQDDLDMRKDDADCIGDYITDEIGASRLQDVDFSAPEAPPELQDDFNEAFNAAIGACDLSVSDIGSGRSDSMGDRDGDAADRAFGSDIGDPEEFASLLAESYEATLGIGPEKSKCLAERMVDAVESGEVAEQDAFGEFFTYLEDCDISLEELSPPAG